MCGVLNNSNKGVFKAIKTEMEFRFFSNCIPRLFWNDGSLDDLKKREGFLLLLALTPLAKVYKHVLNLKPHCRVLRTRLS